jgi:hypothetical protein
MAKRNKNRLNQLARELPDELIVDAAWLSRHGYSTSLRSQYVSAGWLHQPVRRVYRRSRDRITWQQVVVSLQTLLNQDLLVGGRTALDLLGFVHYLSPNTSDVHLYGAKPPPSWLYDLNVGASFHFHNEKRLFRSPKTRAKPDSRNAPAVVRRVILNVGWNEQWQLRLSTPERAILEAIDELPDHESFEHLDKIMAGLTNLGPHRLQDLLTHCTSVKVKRVFFYLAERHRHAWLKHLDKTTIDFGKGKRMLVKGGKLDPLHQITVPRDLDAV